MDTTKDPQKDLEMLGRDLAADLEAEKLNTEEDGLSPSHMAALSDIQELVDEPSQTPGGSAVGLFEQRMQNLSLGHQDPKSFKPAEGVPPGNYNFGQASGDPNKMFFRGLSFGSDRSDDYSNNAT